MNMKYVFSLFLLTFFAVNAYYSFGGKVVNVGGRGSFSNDLLLISNCNDPTRPPVVYLTLDLSYPQEECSGQIEVYYSYYDFPSKTYSEEEQLCIMLSSTDCRGSFFINLGGMGDKKIDVDEFVRLRGVCRANSMEFKSTVPLSINHYPMNVELDALERISEVEGVLYDAKTILDECVTCNSEKYYEIENNLEEYKYQINNCDFTSYVARIVEIRNDAQELKSDYEMKMKSHVPSDGGTPPRIEEVYDEMDETDETLDKIKDKLDVEIDDIVKEDLEVMPNGLCSIGFILPILLFLGLFLFKK